MKTILKSLLILIVLFSSNNVFAQTFSNNYFDEDEFNNSKRVNIPSKGEKSGGATPRVDLSIHSPIAQQQGEEMRSCVAYTFIYGVYGTQIGIRRNIRNSKESTNITLSPMYMFKKMKGNDCKSGLNYKDAKLFIESNGLLRFTDLPTNSCYVNITKDMERKANNFRPIKSVNAVNFKSTDPYDQKYREIIKVLDKENKPVAAGLNIVNPTLFKSLNVSNDIYDPNVNDDSEYVPKSNVNQHFVTVVGFDRNRGGSGRGSFKILNSFGTKWGNNGYCWIPFDVFGKSLRVAYTIVLNEDYSDSNDYVPTSTGMAGEFGIQFRKLVDQGEYIKDIPYMSKSKGIYELNRKNWKVLQEFQILAKSGKDGQSICVFSIDNEEKVELHWPFVFGMDEKDQVPDKYTEMVLPENGLFIEKPGTDKLIVLFSENSIVNDWLEIKEKLEANRSNKSIIERLRDALNGRMIDPTEINYQSNGMSFSTLSKNGDIVPIILKIQSVNN